MVLQRAERATEPVQLEVENGGERLKKSEPAGAQLIWCLSCTVRYLRGLEQRSDMIYLYRELYWK